MGYTAIVDYGVGNLKSVSNAFDYVGVRTLITNDPREMERADAILLPGVGAFPDAAEKLRASKLDTVVLEQGKTKPVLGICLGMQMLFEKSYEYGEHQGLGLLRGSVVPMEGYIPKELKIPHIGWNPLHFERDHKLFRYINEGDCVYFVHSYFATDCPDSVIATAEYGKSLTAAVAYKNVMGCQFHPEKSGRVGLNILRAFCEKEGNA